MSPSNNHHNSSSHSVRTESPSSIDRAVFPFGLHEGSLEDEAGIDPLPPLAAMRPVPKPKQKSSPRQVDAELWDSLLGDQQMGRIPSNLKVLGVDPNPDYSEHSASPNVRRSSNTTSKLVSNIFLAEAKALQHESPLLRRPQNVQAESRQHSGSSTDAQLMQVINMSPSKLRRESSAHLALSSLQRDRGLAYALRRTDSNSTFQSLDGLNSAYPLIRKEAKKRKEQQRSKKQRGKSGQRRSRRSSSRSVQRTRPQPSYAAQTLQCFVNPCLGVDDRVLTVRQEKSRRPRSDSSSHHHHHENKLATRNKLLELKSELTEMRRIASHTKDKPTMSTDAAGTTSSRRRKVKFANPIVSLVKYRPYTEECDIPKLYFQEEELDELEWDREICPPDQFECFIDDKGLAISVDHRFAAHE